MRTYAVLLGLWLPLVVACARNAPRPPGAEAATARPAAPARKEPTSQEPAASPGGKKTEPEAVAAEADQAPGRHAPPEDRIMALVMAPPETIASRLDRQPDLATLVATHGDTALHYAARFGKTELARLLLEHGADARARNDSGETPLHCAVASLGEENLPLVKLLLEAGADVHQKSQLGQTPLVRAIQQGRKQIVRLLLERAGGLSPEQAAEAFEAAVRFEKPEIVDLLLDSALAIDKPLADGRLPLDVAIELGKPELAGHLIDRGADVNAATDDERARRPLHRAAARPDGRPLVTLLLERGADPNATDAQGRTALHVAAASGSAEVVQALVDAGADPNARAPGGLTPLMDAVRMGNVATARALLAAGADRFAKNDTGWEAGNYAQVGRHPELLALLGVEPLPEPPQDPKAEVVVGLLDTIDHVEGLRWPSYRQVPRSQILYPIECRLTVRWPGGKLQLPMQGTLAASQSDRVISELRLRPLSEPVGWAQAVAAVKQFLERSGIELDEDPRQILQGWESHDPSRGTPQTTELSMRVTLEVDLAVRLRVRGDGQWDYQVTLAARPWALAAKIREVAAAWCRQPACALKHDSGEVYCVAFSPDGKYLATSTYRYAHLWDLATRKAVARLGNAKQSEGNVRGVRFSPDRRWLAAIYGDRVARVWHVGTRSAYTELSRPEVRFLAFSPDLKKLLAVNPQHRLEIWDVKNGKPTVPLAWDGPEPALARFSPDGTKILLASRDGSRLALWDAGSGKRQQVLRSAVGLRGMPRDAKFSPSGQRVYVVSSIALAGFDVATGEPRLQIRCPGGRCVAVSSDGKRIAVGSWLGTNVESVRIYDAARERQVAELGKFEPPVHAVCFSPDGARVAAALRSPEALVWELDAASD